MLELLISYVFLVFIAVSSVFFFLCSLLIWLLTVPFDRRLRLLHLFSSFWAAFYVWIMPAWRVSLSGREKVRPEATYMIVSNHQPQVDILVAFMLFIPFKWVSKIEVFRLPFIGWNMVLNRYIALKRGDRESIQKMLANCEETLAAGNSVWIFPEGTRSRSGRLKAFKTGAFTLAKRMDIPILPVVINGSRNALPKNSLVVRGRHRIRVRVLDEIPPERFRDLSAAETAEMVRGIILPHVAEHREDGPAQDVPASSRQCGVEQ